MDQLDELYIEIGGNPTPERLDFLLEECNKLENQINLIKRENNPPLSMDAWVYENDIEKNWENLKEEYGDLAALWCEYKEYHYQEYLENYLK